MSEQVDQQKADCGTVQHTLESIGKASPKVGSWMNKHPCKTGDGERHEADDAHDVRFIAEYHVSSPVQ
jgi:hypothetical protein